MKGVGLIVLVLLAAGGGALLLRRTLRRRRQRQDKRRQFRDELRQIAAAVEQFERTTDFDDQIRLLADITRCCSKAFRIFPDQPEMMNIARFCEDERRKLAQHWAVSESGRLMRLVEESSNLRARFGRADQVAESLKIVSRLLFPHEQITNAMRSVVQYQEALEGVLELPEDERGAAAEGIRSLLDPYFRIMEELKSDNQELARVPWAGHQIRQILQRLEKA